MRLIGIRKKRKITAELGLTAAISPSGSVVGQKSGSLPNVLAPPLGGILSFSALLASVVSGPSLITVNEDVSGSIAPTGTVANVVGTVPSDTATFAAVASISPSGALSVGIDPATVTISRTFGGMIVPSNGALASQVLTITLTKQITAQVVPTGSVAGAASGPSLVTIPASVSGSITPTASVSNATTTPGIPITQSVDGTITPAGAPTSIIDPFTVVVLNSKSGSITPTGVLAVQSNGTITKSIGGSIAPASSVARAVSGPSFVTVPKSVAGTINPHGAKTDVVVPPPITFFSQETAGTIAPASTLSKTVSGPSIVTIPKSVSGIIVPAGARSSTVSGPSFVTVPKAVGGSLVMTGALASLVQGPSFVTFPQAVNGTITPHGAISSGSFVTVTKSIAGTITPGASVARVVSGSSTVVPKSVGGTITPVASVIQFVSGGQISSDPMYVSMGSWDLNEFDLPPAWKSISFTGIQPNDTPAEWKSIFDAMRARGMKGGPAIVGKSTIGDPDPNGGWDFNFTKYKALVDIIAAVSGIAGYISGGECDIFCIADEPQHALFNGTFTPDLMKQCCQYIKSKLPGIKTWVRAPYEKISGTRLPTGGWAGTLDYSDAQYTGPLHGDSGMPKTATPLETYIQQRDALATIGVLPFCGGNWWNGGDGSSGIVAPEGTGFWTMTPVEIRACIDAAVQITQAKYFMWWTNARNSSLGGAAQMYQLQQQSSYNNAFVYCRDTGMARGATNPVPTYFTGTAQQPASYPPPSITVGQAVRDSVFGHKVFHLLDNARLQDADHPALNSDNSTLYFVQGGAGMLGNVTWTVSASQVQVGTVRSAFDTGFSGVVDGVIWDRNDRRFMYYLSGQASLRIFKKDITATTVVAKDIGIDPAFVALWGAQASTLIGSGLHSSRSQERFTGIVGAGLGIFVWDRLTAASWHWKAPAGKTVMRTTIDDIGQYVKIHFTDQTWVNLKLLTNGVYTQLGGVSSPYSPQPVTIPTGTVNISPGTNIQTVVNANVAGTKYLLMAGVHRMQTITPKAGDFFYAQPGAILNGSRLLTAFGTSGALFTATGQTQQGTASGLCTVGTVCSLPEDLWVDDVLQTRVGTLAEVNSAGKWFFDYAADTIYMFSNPSGKTVEITVPERAFVISNINVTIKGLTIEKYSSSGNVSAAIDIFASGCVVEDCEVRKCHGCGISVNTNSQIRRCFVHHNGMIGMTGSTCTGVVIENCEVSFNNTIGFDQFWASGGIKLVNQVNSATVRNCYVHDNKGNGIWYDNCDGPCNTDGNYCADNTQSGIYHEVSGSGTHQNNICVRNRFNILVGNSDHVTVTGNTVSDGSVSGIIGRQVSRPELPARDLNNLLVTNNDINSQVVSPPQGNGVAQFVNNNAYFTSKNNVFNNNRYVFPSTTSAFLSWNNVMNTFAQWRTFGQDAVGSVTAGPGGAPPVPGSSGYLTISDPPIRDDNQSNKIWQYRGFGLRRFTFDPADQTATLVYQNPQRSSKADPYNKGWVSLQAVDEVVYGTLFYSGTISTSWVLHSGEIYKVNWATELAAQPNKGAPEIVRQGIGQLTLVSSLANLTARGQWFYDSATSTLYVRCTDGLSPATKRMVVFDWRFGSEEILMITTAGVLKGRLCHHYNHVSDPTVDVDAARGGSVTYDGSRVLFASNWGGQATMGVYAVLTDPTL